MYRSVFTDVVVLYFSFLDRSLKRVPMVGGPDGLRTQSVTFPPALSRRSPCQRARTKRRNSTRSTNMENLVTILVQKQGVMSLLVSLCVLERGNGRERREGGKEKEEEGGERGKRGDRG